MHPLVRQVSSKSFPWKPISLHLARLVHPRSGTPSGATPESSFKGSRLYSASTWLMGKNPLEASTSQVPSSLSTGGTQTHTHAHG